PEDDRQAGHRRGGGDRQADPHSGQGVAGVPQGFSEALLRPALGPAAAGYDAAEDEDVVGADHEAPAQVPEAVGPLEEQGEDVDERDQACADEAPGEELTPEAADRPQGPPRLLEPDGRLVLDLFGGLGIVGATP